MMSRLSLAPRPQEPQQDSLTLHEGVSTDTREITIVPSPLRPVGNTGQETPAASAVPARPAEPAVPPAADKPAGRPAAGPARPAAGNPGLDELLGRGTPRRRLDTGRLETGRAAADQGPAARQEQDRDEPERQPSRPKRSSVPSWDEIVFGTRGD
jgi:hypothetical protein